MSKTDKAVIRISRDDRLTRILIEDCGNVQTMIVRNEYVCYLIEALSPQPIDPGSSEDTAP